MSRASTVLDSDSASKKYAGFEQDVILAARQVEDLQLKMAIVAPMKAGKSTILNAIIGQELLPSRNTAMTTLPTEIIFDTQLSEPVLVLSSEIRAVFQKAFFSLQRQIRKIGIEGVQGKMPQYPHLLKMVEKIQTKTAGSIPERVLGSQRILNHIGALNDIIRLCSVLDPLANPLQSLTDVPRLYTPIWRSHTVLEDELQTADSSEQLGNLVIVDTPGPNEAQDNLKLIQVVSEQLQKCSFVLLVLDYTQLRTEAAESIKQLVQKVIELRGKDKLYVLINKVDQRRKGDLTPEQIQQIVTADVGIEQTEQTQRVFEVSAIRAFTATNFMRELQQHPDLAISEMETAPALAQEMLGLKWEEKLEQTSLETLQADAKYLWEKSGFEAFLEKAITSLMAEAAPRCILSALKSAHYHLMELYDEVKLRSSAIQEDETKVKLAIEALQDDFIRLEVCRDCLHEVDNIQVKFQQDLLIIFLVIQEECQVSSELFWRNSEYQGDVLTQEMSSEIEKLTHFIQQQGFIDEGTVKFNSFAEAKDFVEIISSYSKKRAERLLESISTRIELQIEQTHENLAELFKKSTHPIIEQAQVRLNENFNMSLSLPIPCLESGEMSFVQLHNEVDFENWKGSNWLWRIPNKEFIHLEKTDQQGLNYRVFLQEIVDEVNQLVEHNLENVQQDINDYLERNIRNRVDKFFNAIECYLSNYCDTLKQVQKDQQLSLESKKVLLESLNSLVSEAEERISQMEIYLQYAEYLLLNAQ